MTESYRGFLYELCSQQLAPVWRFWHVDYDGPEDKRSGFVFGGKEYLFGTIDDMIDDLNAGEKQ